MQALQKQSLRFFVVFNCQFSAFIANAHYHSAGYPFTVKGYLPSRQISNDILLQYSMAIVSVL